MSNLMKIIVKWGGNINIDLVYSFIVIRLFSTEMDFLLLLAATERKRARMQKKMANKLYWGVLVNNDNINSDNNHNNNQSRYALSTEATVIDN